jgi:hypothetical protein
MRADDPNPCPAYRVFFACFQRKYAFEDFAIRQVALLLNKAADEAKYANRSLVRTFSFFSAVQGLRTKSRPDIRAIGMSGILI